MRYVPPSKYAPDRRVAWSAALEPYLADASDGNCSPPPSGHDQPPAATTGMAAYEALTHGCVVQQYTLPEFEREYTRFLHSRMHLADAFVFGAYSVVTAVSAMDFITRPDDVDLSEILIKSAQVAVGLVVVVASAVAHVVCKARLDRITDGGGAGSPLAVDTHAESAAARRVIAGVGSTVVAAFHILALGYNPEACEMLYAPPEVSEYDACARRIPYGVLAVLLLMALVIRHSGALCIAYAVVGAAWISLELTIFRDRWRSRYEDPIRQFLFTCVFAGFFVPMHVARDRSTRQHFVALLLSSVADGRAREAHRQTAAFVAALLPASIARRVAKAGSETFIDLPDGGGGVVQATPALAPLLATLYREAPVATVCITEAADMAAFERKLANTRRVVHGMCHLFTLFDIGAAVFGVERAGCFGDSFTVAAGLEAGSDDSSGGGGSAQQRALDVCRFALWQLGLDEVVTLPLRACVVTGALRGAVLSGGGGQHVRYHVSGPALTLAAGTIGGVPAQHAWACRETHRLAGEARSELQRLRRLAAASSANVSSTGGDAASASPHEPPPSSRTTMPEVGPTTAGAVGPANIFDASPAFETLTIADGAVRIVAPRTASDAHRQGHDESASSSSFPIVHVEWTAAGSVAPPDADDVTHGRVDPYLAALVQATRNDRRMLHRHHVHPRAEPQLDQDPNSDAGGSRRDPAVDKADDQQQQRQEQERIRRAYRREPQLLLPSGAVLVGLLAGGMLLSTLSVEVLDFPSGRRGGTAAIAIPTLALSMVCTVVAWIFAVAAIARREPGWSAIQAGSKVALLAAMAALCAAVWFMPSTAFRNDPGPIVTILLPLASRVIVDTLPPALGSLVILATFAIPVTVVFIPRYDDDTELAQRLAGTVALVPAAFVGTYMIHREVRIQFVAKYYAERRAAASAAELSRLRALVQGMVPAHAIARAVEESGIEALRQRVTTMPAQCSSTMAVPAAVGNNSTTSDADTSETALFDTEDRIQLRELALTLRHDHSANIVVDEFSACVTLHVILPSAARGDGAAVDDALSSAWTTVCAALDRANAEFEGPMARCLDAPRGAAGEGDGSEAISVAETLPGAVPVEPQDRTAPSPQHSYMVYPAPAAAAADHEESRAGAESNVDPLIAITARIAERRPLPLRILEQRGDRVVIGGPFVPSDQRRPDGTSASVHAVPHAVGAAVLVMQQLAHTLPGVACGATVGDAAAAVLGRGTLRYGVYGVLKHHAADLAEAAAAASGIGSSSRVDGAATSVAALSQAFAAVLPGSAAATGDAHVSEFLAALRQDPFPWALRSLGRSRPWLWTSAAPSTC